MRRIRPAPLSLWQSLTAPFLDEARREIDRARAARFVRHVALPPGKEIRASVFLLSYLSFAGNGSALNGSRARLTRMSAAIELLHEASLVHDDLVDGSTTRRGVASAFATNGSGLALLTGDYLLFRGLKLVLDSAESIRDIKLAQELANTGLSIAEGEASQLDRYLHPTDYRDRMSLDAYLGVIGKKTASFFAGCAEAGAALAGAGNQVRLAYREFGMSLGFAFQIVDDTIDVTGDEKAARKNLRSDLAEGVVTLPMIFAYEAFPDNRTLQALGRGEPLTRSQQNAVYRLVSRSGILARCDDLMRQYLGSAEKSLESAPPNLFRLGLADLIEYVGRASWGGERTTIGSQP
jgi:geranylgeranyl pyrophosphate synthase